MMKKEIENEIRIIRERLIDQQAEYWEAEKEINELIKFKKNQLVVNWMFFVSIIGLLSSLAVIATIK
jgi:hypothetical protein